MQSTLTLTAPIAYQNMHIGNNRWPVRRNSVAGKVTFKSMTKRAAVKLWHHARRWDRQTRQLHKHGGVIGPSALAVLYTLLWEFFNWRTGRLDPSIATIAERANLSPRTVVKALARLRDLGLINWVRRCETAYDDSGRFHLRQKSNAYGILNVIHWVGYRSNEAPPPDPATWGATPPLPTPLEVVAAATSAHTPIDIYTTLNSDQTDRLAVALAGLGRAMGAV